MAMLYQRAFAKINLGLRILGRRPDGYHDIETIFHRIDLFDEVFVREAQDIEVGCSVEGLSGEENLAFTAVKLMAERSGAGRGAGVFIRKKIPAGAGLGGGSADAAATLRLLNILWKLNLPDPELHRMALELGSDVPFFLGDRSAHATSRGERLTFFRLPLPYPVLVVFPNIPISTATAFAAVRPPVHENSGDLRSLLERYMRDGGRLRGLLANDFEEYVFRTHPEIGAVRDEMFAAGALASNLTGSGSSVFALFPDESLALGARARFSGRYPTGLTPPGFSPPLGVEEREID